MPLPGKLGNHIDEHPLFPAEDGQDPADVQWIQVSRFENGRQYWALQDFRADDLQTIQDLANHYGGGHYELIGRGPSRSGDPDKKGNIVKRHRWQIAGKSKPLGDSEETGRESESAHQTAAAAPVATSDNLLLGIMQMSQAQAQAQAAAAQQQSQQFMQMMATLMAGSKTESQNMMTMMMSMMQSGQQSMAQIMTAVLSQRAGGPDEMAKMLALVKEMGGIGKKDDDDELFSAKTVENLADAVQGVHSIISMQRGGPPTVEPVPPGLPTKLTG